jgi:hypothetical protein
MDPLEQTVADTYVWVKDRIEFLLSKEMYLEATNLYEEYREWLVESDVDHEVISLNV